MDDSSQFASTVPAASEGIFRLFICRVKNVIIFIRRTGVPHEETIIIPAVALNVASSFFQKDGWPFLAAILFVAATSFLCGMWLGFAWRGFPVFRILIRTIYIGVLSALLYMLFHDEIVTKTEAVHTVGQIVSSAGLLFYLGYIIAAVIRDVALRKFSSETQRQRYLSRISWWKHIWRLVRKKEDDDNVSDWDFMVARFISSCLDIKAIPAILLVLTLIFHMNSYFK